MPPDYPPQPPPPPSPQAEPHPASYDFIMNPQQAPRKPLLPGANSMVIRIGIIAGGLVVLLILFAVFKNVLIKGPDLSGYVTVAQDQQEIIHLVNNITANNTQRNLSANNQNLAATVQLSLASNQSQVLTYLSNQHQKVNPKVLKLRVNSALDTQLVNAQTAGTYDQTFQSIMQSQLNTYMSDLSRTYQASKGKNGRALLSKLYNQAKLLLDQIATPGN